MTHGAVDVLQADAGGAFILGVRAAAARFAGLVRGVGRRYMSLADTRRTRCPASRYTGRSPRTLGCTHCSSSLIGLARAWARGLSRF